MTSAWKGTIGNLKQSVISGNFLIDISRQFDTVYHAPSRSERESWSQSIPAVLKVLESPAFDHIHAILELQMPVGAERADLVLLGGTPRLPSAVVIELKQWSSISVHAQTMEVEVPGLGMHQHPALQTLNYAGKLSLFNSRAHGYHLHSVIYMHNASHEEAQELSHGKGSEWLTSAPVFSIGEETDFSAWLAERLLPAQLPDNEHDLFESAPYEQSQKLFDFLRRHAKDIAKNAEVALANSGMGLTEEQDRIKNEIIAALETGEERDFIIQGNPGSGKTLLSLSLLLRAAENNISCLLALRNNRLQAILRRILDDVYPGVSGLMVFFEPKQGRGIYQFDGHVDLLIVDEGQRMESRIMPTVLRKARVCAIFLDETQRLNPPEQGTIENFSEASKGIKPPPVVRILSTGIRCRGGEAYAQWIESLLREPGAVTTREGLHRKFEGRYVLEFAASIQALLHRLNGFGTNRDRVALVASFTESPGKPSPIEHIENRRIGYPLQSGFRLYEGIGIDIPWLMTTSHYQQFWIQGRSNQLDRVASIYGAQGFESEFVGVIWGRDLVIRNGHWALGNPDFCFDSIDGLIRGKKFGQHYWHQDAFELVVNRYRIFLTRGIKGTIIFCEDEETRKFFSGLDPLSSLDNQISPLLG